jgi:hypothetical protein
MLDALTTPPFGPDRQWRGVLLNAERSFRRLKGHRQMQLLVAALARDINAFITHHVHAALPFVAVCRPPPPAWTQ